MMRYGQLTIRQMTTFDQIIIVISVGSMAFFMIIFSRLFAYNRIYKFPENKYTKLFGVLRKEHILFFYLVVTLFLGALGLWVMSKV